MLRLAVPGVIGALFFSALGLTEASYLKQAGSDALAAVAVVFPLVMLAAMLSAGAIGGAISGQTARSIGAGDHDQASAVLVCSVVISFIGGALMWLLIVLFGEPLFNKATSNATVSAAAAHYAAIVFPAMPAFWLVNMLSSVLRGSGDMVRPAIVAAFMLVTYIILAALLIPDEAASLNEAVQAAGLSMVGAYLCSLVLTLFFVLQRRQPIRFRISAFRMRTLTGILKQGLLAGSQSVMTIIYAVVTTALFSRFGTEWLAGYGLAVRLELIMIPVIFGMGGSLIAIVGAYAGAGQRSQAISIAWRGIFINAALVGAIGLMFALFPGLWCNQVGSDLTVINHCEQSLRVIAPTYAFFAIGLGAYFACQGLNTLLYPVLGALLRLTIVSTGLLWISDVTSAYLALALVAFAVVTYGSTVAMGLYYRAWR